MKETLARIEFKRLLGQANHFLVTTLVGLDCLDKNQNHQAVGLHAVWSPKDAGISIQRSRVFILHAFLASAVDALDVYFSLLNRKPDFLQNKQLSGLIQGCGRSVYQKATVLSHWVNQFSPPKTRGIAEVEAALVEVLITWRNNVQHELADNIVSVTAVDAIEKHAAEINGSYCNLDPAGLVNKANGGVGLTFKEAASLINATHKYVEHIDSKILAALNKSVLIETTILDALKSKSGGQGFRVKIFDVKSMRWNSFVSNWVQNILRFPTPTWDELLQIKKFISSLKN